MTSSKPIFVVEIDIEKIDSDASAFETFDDASRALVDFVLAAQMVGVKARGDVIELLDEEPPPAIEIRDLN